MPDDNKPKNDPPTTRGTAPQTPLTELPAGGVVGLSTGGDVAVPDGILAGRLPVGAGSITLDTGKDITDELGQASPAFGNVLMAVGNAVAGSQQALDKSLVDTVKKLSDTKIKVVTQVLEELNDDGIPDPTKTKLITNEVSVLNFFTPDSLRWQRVSISVDLAVGAFHAEQGVQFTKHQESTSAGGSFTWGFGGWFNFQHASSDQSVQTNAEQNVAWSSGQCLIDAELTPRQTGKFPVPASVTIGPQIYVTQGAVSEQKTGETVTSRSVVLLIELRKRSGEPMQQGVNITLETGGLLPSFATGSSTDINGQVKVTLTRSLSVADKGFKKFQGSVGLKSITTPFTVTL